MTTTIHPSAIISPNAKLGNHATVGPYAVIHDHVEIGDNATIDSHAVILPYVRMGNNNRIHSHAVIGDTPQDVTFNNAETWVEIGDHNIFREAVTIHRASHPDRITRIGSHCFLMVNTHIAHDCQIGNHVIITNNTHIGGHAQIGDKAVLGGAIAVHQYVRIGAYAMIAAHVMVRKDILPFSMSGGSPLKHYRLNTIGLRRAGISGGRYKALEDVFRQLRNGRRDADIPSNTDECRYLNEWLSQNSKRGLSGFTSTGKFFQEEN